MSDTPPVCDYEGSDYQSRFWVRGGRNYEDRAERVAVQRLLPPVSQRRGRLLEIGAGFGRLSDEYAGYDDVVLLDYSRTLLREARQRLGDGGHGGPRYTYVAANVYQLPFLPGTFAAAAMVRVIHHIADVPLALHQIHGALAAGAPFVLEFANKQHLKAIGRWLLRRQAWDPFAPEPVEFVALNFDFSPRWMRAQLAAAGFSVERQLTVSHFRVGLLKRLVPTGLLVAADSLIQHSGNWWQLSPSVFVRSRAAGAMASPATSGALAFRCPACHEPLPEPAAGRFTCTRCGNAWAYQDGLYDFREPIA